MLVVRERTHVSWDVSIYRRNVSENHDIKLQQSCTINNSSNYNMMKKMNTSDPWQGHAWDILVLKIDKQM